MLNCIYLSKVQSRHWAHCFLGTLCCHLQWLFYHTGLIDSLARWCTPGVDDGMLVGVDTGL